MGDIDDMGDDPQEEQIREVEYYLEDPPDGELGIEETSDDDEIGISEYVAEERRPGERPWPPDEKPAEEEAIEVRGYPRRREE